MKNVSSTALGFTLGVIIGLIVIPSLTASPDMNRTVFAQSTTMPSEDQRPNIMLIVGDDFGWSDIGAFGSEISTPNLDQLAKEGRIGMNYHTAPTCSPARDGLLTGVDWHIGGLGNMYELIAANQVGKPGYETYLNDKVVTVQELLRDAGYNTMQAGKWHLSGNQTPFTPGTSPYDRGFQNAFTLVGDSANHFTNGSIFPGGHTTFIENDTIVKRPGNGTLFSNDLYTNKMIEYLNKTQGDGKPFFGYLAFQVAHSPFMTPPGTMDKYGQIYSAGWDEMRVERFQKQKELGIWPANMTLPQSRPPNEAWDSLSQEERDYAVGLLSVRAGMIENMDQNIGKLVDHLKQTGQYDNTLIIFTSDNGGSEATQLPEGILVLNGVDYTALPGFLAGLNDTVPNLGNATTSVNYGAWGSTVSVAPLAGFKASVYEGGIRAPFIIREPASATVAAAASTGGNTSSSSSTPIRSFMMLTDLTPTILDYANVPQAGSTYEGREVHPIMGKSIRPLLNGSAEEIHGADDPTGVEMFNNTALFKGPWVALMDNSHPTGKGWELYNIETDPGQNNNVADQNPDLLKQMIADYQTFAKEVGVVVPTGEKAAIQFAGIYPALNETQTVNIDEIIPPFKKPTGENAKYAMQMSF